MSRGRSLRRAAAPLSLLSLLLGACAAPPPPELRLGLIGVFDSVSRTTSGMPARLAARMAVDELNATGGVLIDGISHRVVLRERSIPDRPDAAAAAVRALVAEDSIDVIIGPQSDRLAVAAGGAAEAARVPLVAPMASQREVTAARSFVVRLMYPHAEQGDVIARFAYDSLGIRRVAVMLAGASDVGQQVAERFGSTFTALGGRLVANEPFVADDTIEQRRRVERVIISGPTAILMPDLALGDSAQVRALRAAGFRGRILGSDAWDAFALRAIPDLNGSIIVANWDGRSDRDGVRVFRERWTAQFLGERPRATGAATYDAVRLVARAAEKARARGGPALVRAWKRGAPFDGAFARYRFDGSADPVRGATILEMHNDSLLFRGTLLPRR